MRAQDLIRKKRDGGTLTREEFQFLIAGYTSGQIPDYQMSAFTMAIYFQGMSKAETVAFTECMLHSGIVVDLHTVPGRKVDKHSTGGVGDKISLPLAPAVAAAGVPVPMISGRGLGHTGGTLDKLESIPGFQVNLPVARYTEILQEIGICMIGQTEDIAPADKKLYALRDVTATVESIPLITASILSKKLAEGIDAVVFDVKSGSGAFMKTDADAAALARNLVEISSMMGKEAVALITDMQQPLGNAVGNTVEMLESLDVMEGEGPEDIITLTVELGAYMLLLGKTVESVDQGRLKMYEVLSDGSALEKFQHLVRLQGGDPRVLVDPERFVRAASQTAVLAEQTGYIQTINAESVGIASMLLGAGRERLDSKIDHSAGVLLRKKVGDPVACGEPLCVLEYNDATRLHQALTLIKQAYVFGDNPPPKTPLIKQVIQNM